MDDGFPRLLYARMGISNCGVGCRVANDAVGRRVERTASDSGRNEERPNWSMLRLVVRRCGLAQVCLQVISQNSCRPNDVIPHTAGAECRVAIAEMSAQPTKQNGNKYCYKH